MPDNYFSCNIPCAESCPPCNRKCTYSCKHSRCSRQCGQLCRPCKVRISTCFIFTQNIVCLSVSHIKGGTQAGVCQEWDVEESVGYQRGGVNGRLEETAWWGVAWFYIIFMYSAVLLRDTNYCRSESLFTRLLQWHFLVQGYVDCSCVPDWVFWPVNSPFEVSHRHFLSKM